MGANNGLDGVLTMVATPSVFFNECEISFKFDWRSPADLPPDVNVQVTIFYYEALIFFRLFFFTFYCPSHGLILYGTEGFLSELLCVHNVDKETLFLSGLILRVSEGFFSELLCIHIEGMGTFGLHGLILCVSEG